MKLNRRDYLKRMGAASVIAGATRFPDFTQQQECTQTPRVCPTDPGCINPTGGAPRVWEPRWCDPFPPCDRNQYVKLIFEGLMGFARRKVGNQIVCDIGFHDKGEAPIHHHLEITAYSAINAGSCGTAVYKTGANTKIKKLVLEVPQPRVVDQTYFYQPGAACGRQQLTDYQDFRWIVDFESDYMHGKHLEKNKNIYRPVLTINSGIFYTLRKTASTFRAQTEDGEYVCHLGNVADIFGANIYVESRSHVTLKVDGECHEIFAPGEIYFRNHCVKDAPPHDPCQFFPYNLKEKKKRSDFFLNYKAFDRGTSPEYLLYLAESHIQTVQPDVTCEKDKYPIIPDPTPADRLNDEAPCSGAGFGAGNFGFP